MRIVDHFCFPPQQFTLLPFLSSSVVLFSPHFAVAIGQFFSLHVSSFPPPPEVARVLFFLWSVPSFTPCLTQLCSCGTPPSFLYPTRASPIFPLSKRSPVTVPSFLAPPTSCFTGRHQHQTLTNHTPPPPPPDLPQPPLHWSHLAQMQLRQLLPRFSSPSSYSFF